jgi:hypothetical protein
MQAMGPEREPKGNSRRADVHVKRYSQSQVLCGLRDVWKKYIGTDASFDFDTRIDTFTKADGTWEELDFADIFYRLEHFFGFKCSDKEWGDFLGLDTAKHDPNEWQKNVAPSLTFGSLSLFIAQRAPVVASFDPLQILGGYCPTAGVFTAIQRVADKVRSNRQGFAPSTRIIDVLRGSALDKFWTQLRWLTEHSLPELPPFWRNVTGYSRFLEVFLVFFGLVGVWATSEIIWFVSTLVCAAALYVMAASYKQFTNPLPSGIISFRDISKLIVQSQKKVAS